MLKDLSIFKLSSKYIKSTFCIPILDKDPLYAAHFLTKKDLKPCYEALIEAFNDIEKTEPSYTSNPIVQTIMYSKVNYDWFVIFFKEVEKLLQMSGAYFIKPVKHKLKSSVCNLEVYQPYRACKIDNKNFIFQYLDSNIQNRDPINNYRIRYITDGYEMRDFQEDSFPAWYIITNTTIFEQYDERVNKRVRVDIKDGELYYFTAGASDNWKPIENVPREMDYVISALIFRHGSSNS